MLYAHWVLVTDETLYLDRFQYYKGNLVFFPHAEGYVDVIATDNRRTYFSYVFNYLDHLGNIRMSWAFDKRTQALKVVAENHYLQPEECCATIFSKTGLANPILNSIKPVSNYISSTVVGA